MRKCEALLRLPKIGLKKATVKSCRLKAAVKNNDFKAGLYLQKKVRKYFYSAHDQFFVSAFQNEIFEIKRNVYDFMNSQACTVTLKP